MPALSVLTPANRGTADPAFIKTLTEAVDQETPAVYVTYTELLGSLSMIPDERQRYQAALAAQAKTYKVEPDAVAGQLRTALEARVRGLEKAKTLFANELDHEAQTSVGDKAAQIKSLDDRMLSLRQELERMSTERAELQTGIDQANQRLEVSKTKFASAVTAVESTLAAEHQKFTNYLG